MGGKGRRVGAPSGCIVAEGILLMVRDAVERAIRELSREVKL